MSRWFLYFLIYSFLGYCLEKLFARAVHSERQVRKCFLLLPLCPVYGLAMTAVLAIAPTVRGFFSLAVAGGIVSTLIEYLVHWFYDRILGVSFWDYSALRGNLNARVCPQFSLLWGILSATAVLLVQPLVAFVAAALSPGAVFLLWVLFVADCVFTTSLLLHCHNTELLSLTALIRRTGRSQ